MLFWVLYSLLTLIWIKDFQSWIKMYIILISGFIITYFIGLYFTKKRDIIVALKIIEFMSLIFGIIALYEMLTGNYLYVAEHNLTYFQERSQELSSIGWREPVSVFGNPNNYSLFLLFSSFCSLGLARIKNTKRGRLFSLILLLFFIFLLITTQSRSGFIGFALGFTSYLVIIALRSRSRRITDIILILGALFLLIIPFVLNNKNIFEPLMEVDFNAQYGSDAIRINLIKNGWNFLYNTHFLGVGIGNVEYYMKNYAIYPTGGVTNIHNWWMEILVSSGIIVFVVYLVIYFKNMKRLFRFSKFKDDFEMQHISTVFLCFLISFFIASVGASSLMYNEWIWPVFALIMSFINLYTPSVKSI